MVRFRLLERPWLGDLQVWDSLLEKAVGNGKGGIMGFCTEDKEEALEVRNEMNKRVEELLANLN